MTYWGFFGLFQSNIGTRDCIKGATLFGPNSRYADTKVTIEAVSTDTDPCITDPLLVLDETLMCGRRPVTGIYGRPVVDAWAPGINERIAAAQPRWYRLAA